ncbi:MAG: hypothetical protein HAW67_04690 [Endozoicomonadaceae bacterium]|nr:hypothetical protein [Endozoicomonadaceae bacterium]
MIEVSDAVLTVKQLQISKKNITKSKLADLTIISNLAALELLTDRQVNFIGKFNSKLYFEIVNKHAATFSRNCDHLLPAHKHPFEDIQNNLFGVILYNDREQCVMVSYFCQNNRLTVEHQELSAEVQQLESTIKAVNAISNDDYTSCEIAKALCDFNNWSFPDNIELSKYLDLCFRNDHSEVRLPTAPNPYVASDIKSDEWFEKLGTAEEISGRRGMPIKHTPEWILKTLSTPYTFKSWSETKHWLTITFQTIYDHDIEHLKRLDANYESVMHQFIKAPILFI